MRGNFRNGGPSLQLQTRPPAKFNHGPAATGASTAGGHGPVLRSSTAEDGWTRICEFHADLTPEPKNAKRLNLKRPVKAEGKIELPFQIQPPLPANAVEVGIAH